MILPSMTQYLAMLLCCGVQSWAQALAQCDDSATPCQVQGIGLLQTEQFRLKQDASMGTLFKEMEPNSSVSASGWQSRLHAVVEADGQSAVVRLPTRGGHWHEYRMSLTSVYSNDAVVTFHTALGSTNTHPHPRRTFSSQVDGRRARATIWDDGSVAGLFEYGPHLLKIRPFHKKSSISALQESEDVLHTVHAVGDSHSQHAGPEFVVDDIGAPENHTDAIFAPAGSDALPSLSGSAEAQQKWSGVKWFPGCFAGDRAQHSFKIGVATDYKAWQLYGTELQSMVEDIVGEASMVYENQMNLKLEIADLQIYTNSDPSKQPDWVSGCKNGDEVRQKLNQFTFGWTPPSRQTVWHLFTGCGNSFGIVGVAYLGKICESRFNTGVNMLRGWRGSVVEDTWDTFAHELGHNFDADHTFEEGQGRTGGIMDYGDGKLNGVYQFNTKYRKAEMCRELSTKKPLCGNLFAKASEPMPTPAPTPMPSRPTPTPSPYIMRDASIPDNTRCAGLPIKLNGKTWAGLGKRLSPEACKEACLSEEKCRFAVYRVRKGMCSAFASCNAFDERNGFVVWEKVMAPDTPTPSPQQRMVPALMPAGHRCKGRPMTINGKRWSNLGEGRSPESCQRACLDRAVECNFVVLKQGRCSAFKGCAKTQYEPGFEVWRKVTS
jgi:hypothetical protein